MGSNENHDPMVRMQPKWYPEYIKTLPTMDEKIVAITGTTSGTGYITARTALILGATVIMMNRKSTRSDKAMEQLMEEFPDAKLSQIECDLQSFESVKAACEQLLQEYADTGIDVFAGNAGVMALKNYQTDDGYDVQMQTNHFSHFLIVKELFPLFVKSSKRNGGDTRIVMHSSGARNFPKSDLKENYFSKNPQGNGNNGLGRWKRYQQTKAANCVFTAALAEKLQGSGIKAVVAEPGLAATNLQTTTNKDGGMGKMLGRVLFALRGQSAEDGSMPLIHCVMAENVENGDFYGPRTSKGPVRKKKLDTYLQSKKNKELLWRKSEEAVGEFTVEF